METTEAVEVAAPEAQVEKPKRRKAPTEGEQLVALIKGAGIEMPPDQEGEMLEISDELGAKAYLLAHLPDGMKPDRMMAMSVFSHWLYKRIPLNEILATQQIYAMEIGKQVVADADRILASSERTLADGTKQQITAEHHLAANRMKLMAADRISSMILRAQKLAALIKTPTELPKPKNRAPDVLSQQNVLVQVARDGVTVTETKRSTEP